MSEAKNHAAPSALNAARRNLFGAAGAMLLATAAASDATKAAELDTELLACCAGANAMDVLSEAVCVAVDNLPVGDPRVDAAYTEAKRIMAGFHPMVERAAMLPARTPEGLRAKAALTLSYLRDGDKPPDVALSLARDLLGRA